ncbi:MAG: TusE/DsrC/DsvC family sulfur relay protein [Eggerthellaceae bacterium]|nr:TusE/DsrC/DsvC family sulfur relay protein [Eggerthellaceae bacterium]
MPTNTINGFSFEVNDEGFFEDREQWSEDLARELAALIDIELTEEHLKVLRFARDDQASTGAAPTLNRMNKTGGFVIKDLFRLFPGKPAKKIAWLSGLKKPVSCV